MSFDQAQALQLVIASTHPLLPVSIHTLGNDTHPEYVCFMTPEHYYLWTLDDWNVYRVSREKRLNRYTSQGNESAKQANRKNRVLAQGKTPA